MVILVNKNIPRQALRALTAYGELVLFETRAITYLAISGHSDIFFCVIGDSLVMAPNVPEAKKMKLKKLNIKFNEGYEIVGQEYPATARYNCVVTDEFLIGKKGLIDKKIWEQTAGKEFIHVKQGYTRCNLLPLANNRFITSDKGIENALDEKGLEVLYVNPEGIQLPGFDHGFFGGVAGIYKDQVFFIGNLDHYAEGEKIRRFLSDYEIIELYDGPLFDGGSIILI